MNDDAISTSVVDATLIPTTPPTATIEPTEVPLDCPTDPAEWELTDSFLPTSNLKNIPACVREDTDRTIMWALAAGTLGYTHQEAADTLGFSSPPAAKAGDAVYEDGFKTLLDFSEEPEPFAVVLLWDHPQLRQWNLNDSDTVTGKTYYFAGCFRTTRMVGGQLESWSPASMICQYTVDSKPTGRITLETDNQMYSEDFPDFKGYRTYAWVGYAGNGDWFYIGESVGNDYFFPYDPTVIAAGEHINPDDYDLAIQPLPEGYLERYPEPDPEAAQAIVDEINSYEEE